MIFRLNGADFKPTQGSVNLDGKAVDKLIVNGQFVWYKYEGPSSPITITSDKTMVAGVDFPSDIDITLCMCGGGGSGISTDGTYINALGGFRGQIHSEVVRLAFNESVSVVIGSGGASVDGTAPGTAPGLPGEASSFGSYATASGAPSTGSTGYLGQGAAFNSPCGSSYNDGEADATSRGFGGQAGAFGNGGNGSVNQASDGGVGAGGGGSRGSISGAGGKGQIVISW